MPKFSLLATPFDQFNSETTKSQIKTEDKISKFLIPWSNLNSSSRNIDSAILARSDHIEFLKALAFDDLPQQFSALDASRGWMLYWSLGSLDLLGINLDQDHRIQAIKTILSFQHPNGGFGGGPGQMAHLAATYAAILAITILLKNANQSLLDQTWNQINLKNLYNWILDLKLQDGSFLMQYAGEVDVRACYCALVIATICNFLTPDLVAEIPQYLASCQTYEGGMTTTAIRTPNSLSTQHQSTFNPIAIPLGEAHGGYAFCAFAAHVLLQSVPSVSGSFPLDYDAGLRWLSQAQGLPIEGGGFRGRTNKLVDGCYSWWCAGCFPLLESMITNRSSDQLQLPDLFDRQALQEYILLVSQDQPPEKIPGGLRDKPDMPPDVYHTLYVLSGLSHAQNYPTLSLDKIENLKKDYKEPDLTKCIIGTKENSSQAINRMKEIYSNVLGWEVKPEKKLIIGDPSNAILPLHPAFNVTLSAAKKAMDYFYHQ
ncbi:hypothetical protein O181_107302 [Austropuccinia psidii MF-1]|uniref:Protein farnesyltransferase subunit beta n=1 Tax=Austropuccinia psidii MF-1 TaxID=1389203 RepID=A0A9Q3JTP7_9BASI|nr:hypothetical protein [Austropuccinia psidii MF-1]